MPTHMRMPIQFSLLIIIFSGSIFANKNLECEQKIAHSTVQLQAEYQQTRNDLTKPLSPAEELEFEREFARDIANMRLACALKYGDSAGVDAALNDGATFFDLVRQAKNLDSISPLYLFKKMAMSPHMKEQGEKFYFGREVIPFACANQPAWKAVLRPHTQPSQHKRDSTDRSSFNPQ